MAESMIKTLGHACAAVRAVPHVVCYRVGSAVMGQERAFIAASECVARVPGNRGIYLRQVFYRRSLEYVGRDVHFGFMSVLSKPAARISDRVYIGRFCSLGWVDLGEGVLIADGVQILSGGQQHMDGPDATPQFTKVTIGRGAWIGAGAIVMADVGPGAVVGAGAVVTRPVEVGQRVAGVPARPMA